MKQPTLSEFFNWHHHPFADTHALKDPFCSQRDERICSSVKGLISHGKSLMLTGASGTGKTTLVNNLIHAWDPNRYQPIYIQYGGISRMGLLRALAEILGVDAQGRRIPLLSKIQNFIYDKRLKQGSSFPVLIIDDAHLLERDSLLDLCSLLMLPGKNLTAASLILIGDTDFPKLLHLHVMAPVRTRLTVNFHLDPLTESESEDFVKSRLQQAKAPVDLLDPEVLSLMAISSHGNRRELMNMGTVLVDEAFYREEKTISSQLFLSVEFMNSPD